MGFILIKMMALQFFEFSDSPLKFSFKKKKKLFVYSCLALGTVEDTAVGLRMKPFLII